MNILHRYIFRQLFGAGLIAVGLFVFVLVVGNLMREVLDRLAGGTLDWLTFCYLVVINVPGVVPYALPLGLLTAVLMVVGRMCAQNEYTAMRAAGLSLWTLAAPVMLLGCLGVVFCLFINFYYAPAADKTARVVLQNWARNHPTKIFQPGVFVYDLPGYVFYAGDRDGDALKDVWAWQIDSAGRAVNFARAPKGTVGYDAANDELVVTLSDATVQAHRGSDPEFFQDATVDPTIAMKELPYAFSLAEIFKPSGDTKKLSLMTLPELLDARDVPPFPKPTPEQREQWSTKVRMQIQMSFAGAFSVLALAMIAVPLGLKTGRAETFANLGIALALALGYYIMVFLIKLLQGHPALHPDVLVWLPDVLFEGLGLWLLWRAARR